MKLIPAVFFQKKVNGVEAAAKTPERLELFESELRAVVGTAAAAPRPIRVRKAGWTSCKPTTAPTDDLHP